MSAIMNTTWEKMCYDWPPYLRKTEMTPKSFNYRRLKKKINNKKLNNNIRVSEANSLETNTPKTTLKIKENA